MDVWNTTCGTTMRIWITIVYFDIYLVWFFIQIALLRFKFRKKNDLNFNQNEKKNCYQLASL